MSKWIILIAAIVVSACSMQRASHRAERPNFLFILVDDLGYKDLGYTGSTFYETPNIDALAATGMVFTQAYAASPVCSPARAAIMSGKYPATLNLTDYIPGNQHYGPHPDQQLASKPFTQMLDTAETTFAEVLKKNGYATFFAGKWHLGEQERYFPNHHGFDINKGGNGTGHPAGGYFSPYKNPQLTDGPEGEYLTDRLADETIQFLREKRGRPFLAFLSFYNVHLPLQAKPEKVAHYASKSKGIAPAKETFVQEGSTYFRQTQSQPEYAAMVESVDDAVGRVLRVLEELGLSENTVVIFTSDNGGMASNNVTHNVPTSNQPLRAGKGYLYEGGIRVPLIIRWPSKIPAKAISDVPVIGIDYYPTILSLAGVKPLLSRQAEGVDLTRVFSGGKLERRPVFWHYPHYSGGLGGRPSGAVRLGNYKLIEFYEDMHVELYDVVNDPGERKDLALVQREKVDELRRILHHWRGRVEAQMPYPNPAYKGDASDTRLKLWYDKPADASVPDDSNGWKDDPEWLSALPLGNGSLGAMVFGDVGRERIQLNEESMWSGSRQDADNPDAYPAQDEIRRLLFAGKYREATVLTNKTQVCKGAGSGRGNGANVPFGSFQTLGDLWIDHAVKAPHTNYHRELNLEDAVVRVNYTQQGVNYKREVFISYPDQVLVAHFTADKPRQLSFTCAMTRPERYKTYTTDGQLIMSGALSDGKGGDGLQYMARLKAVAKNGDVTATDNTIVVTDADEVTLYLAASTNYFLDYPHYTGRDFESITARNITQAVTKGFERVLQDHQAEYSEYFSRVRLDLASRDERAIPTDDRIDQYRETKSDPLLEELLFQYGRYLLIASSRPGTLPANLQGIWSNKVQTPWNGDYHTNVNIQMNYWPAEVANLSEMHLPLFDLIESLVVPGSKTAAIHYQSNGWIVHPITNVWGFTAPGEVASWGMHAGAGAWLSTHIFEHFSFSRDTAFLKRMFPVLKGSAQFYMDWLVKDPRTGKLVSGPATSPENTFVAPDGSRSQISMGPAHDQQVIWQLFTDLINASRVLDIDDVFAEQVSATRDALAGPTIGSDGRLLEWAQEYEEVEPGHRHLSHLFALHPGNQINAVSTPALVEAARRSLDYRIAHGGGHTGWSAAWLINHYARLHDADKAKASLGTVLAKSTAPNLFGLHPPFQMDANFGATAGIAEMLLQSHAGFIELLPALPVDWPSGKVSGLRARGGVTVSMEWEDGRLKQAHLTASGAVTTKVKYGDQVESISLRPGQTFDFSIK